MYGPGRLYHAQCQKVQVSHGRGHVRDVVSLLSFMVMFTSRRSGCGEQNDVVRTSECLFNPAMASQEEVRILVFSSRALPRPQGKKTFGRYMSPMPSKDVVKKVGHKQYGFLYPLLVVQPWDFSPCFVVMFLILKSVFSGFGTPSVSSSEPQLPEVPLSS